MNRRQALRQIASASVVVGLAGCTEEDTDDSNGGSETTDTDNSDTSEAGGSTSLEDTYPNAWAINERFGIVVLSADAVVEQYGTTITGEVVNASDTDYDYVQLSFDLLAEDDTKIADALANTSGLQAGQRWRYEALGRSSPDITTFRLVEVTAY
jgi:hypothetical protein